MRIRKECDTKEETIILKEYAPCRKIWQGCAEKRRRKRPLEISQKQNGDDVGIHLSSLKMLQNAPSVANIGLGIAENGPRKNLKSAPSKENDSDIVRGARLDTSATYAFEVIT